MSGRTKFEGGRMPKLRKEAVHLRYGDATEELQGVGPRRWIKRQTRVDWPQIEMECVPVGLLSLFELSQIFHTSLSVFNEDRPNIILSTVECFLLQQKSFFFFNIIHKLYFPGVYE